MALTTGHFDIRNTGVSTCIMYVCELSELSVFTIDLAYLVVSNKSFGPEM
jgi:hypothetical protein